MKKKIVFFNNNKFWGGGEKLHLDHCIRLKERGHLVWLMCRKGSMIYHKAKEKEIRTKNIKINNLSFFLNPLKYLEIIIFLKKENIEVLITSDSSCIKIAGICAKLLGIKKVIYWRLVAFPIKNNFINRFLFKKIINITIANSLNTKKNIIKNFDKSIFKNKIKVIYHGIDIEKTYNLSKQAFKLPISKEKDEIIFGNVARLSPEKNQKYLISIADRLKSMGIKFKILIAGEGDLRESLEISIKEKKLSNEVILLGFVKNIPAFLKEIDIFLFCSKYEGFGIAIIEAMALEKPVIALKNDAIEEIIKDKVSGLIVDNEDIDAFVAKIQIIIKNKNLMKKIALNSKKAIEKNKIEDELNGLEKAFI